MTKWGVLGLLGFLLGCAPKGPPKVNCKTACVVEYTVRLDPAFTQEEARQVWFGLTSWSRASSGAVCYTPQTDKGFDLAIVRGETQQSLHPYIDHPERYAAIYKQGTIIIAMNATNGKLASIAAHEAGHALGLPHAPEASTSSVMHFKSGELVENDLPESDRKSFYGHRCK